MQKNPKSPVGRVSKYQWVGSRPGMSAPGAGGERLLFPICDSAPRDTGDPNKSALGAGRSRANVRLLGTFTRPHTSRRIDTCGCRCTDGARTLTSRNPQGIAHCDVQGTRLNRRHRRCTLYCDASCFLQSRGPGAAGGHTSSRIDTFRRCTDGA